MDTTSISPPPSDTPCSLDTGPRGSWYGVYAYALCASIFIIALLFDATINRLIPVPTLALSQLGIASSHSIQIAKESLAWRGSSLLLLGACAPTFILCCTLLYKTFRTFKPQTSFLLAGGLLVALSALLIHRAGPTSYFVQLISFFETSSLMFKEHQLNIWLALPRRVAEFTAGWIGLAMCSILVLPRTLTQDDIHRKLRELRLLLYVSAIMLVLAVFVTRTSYLLAASYSLSPKELDPLVEHATLLAAFFYTLVLATGYVPVAAILTLLSRKLADIAVSTGQAQTPEQWLQTNQLSDTWKPQLTRILTVIAPSLAAAVPHFSSLWNT